MGKKLSEKPFKFNPDAFESDSTPKDIMNEGKCLAYYDTQSACWRLGDRSNPTQGDKPFTDKQELKKYLKDSEGVDVDFEDLKKSDAQADAA